MKLLLVEKFLSGLAAVRWCLTIYSGVLTLYGIYEIVKHSHPPEFRFHFLP
jgi:hypothetical protein